MNLGKMLLYQPLWGLLVFLYHLFGNLGLAIIFLTLIIRFLLLPLTLPGIKAALKMQQLAPQLEKLKKKYGTDKQKLAAAQMSLYRQYKINPAAGCLPQIVQIVILITLYRVLNDVLSQPDFNRNFLYLDLGKPDLFSIQGKNFPGFFLILSVVSQYFAAKVTLPAVKKEEKLAKKTPETTDDFSAAMQKQSLYLFPLMTFFFGFTFPSGLIIYWAIFSLFNLVQQWWLQKRGLVAKK